MLRSITIFLLLACSVLTINAQKRSAQKPFQEAIVEINQLKAISLFEQAINKDSTYTEAYLHLARLYERREQYDQQVNTLKIASLECERNSPFIFAQLSQAAYLNGDYLIAKNAISQVESENNAELKYLKDCIAFSLETISHPSHFEAHNLGKEVNTPYHDYWPSISIDEAQIVTTVFVDNEDDEFRNSPQEDLFFSQKGKQTWSQAKPLSKLINSKLNEGAQSLSADGKIMLFTACNRFDGKGDCDIYLAYQRNDAWSSPVPLPAPLNTIFWEGHPSLSADGKQLYFSSNRTGGYGGRDLYVAEVQLRDTIAIGEVQNLGPLINTPKHEISPFIHPDGKTLYFSSNGHIGLGRQDIYYATKDSSGFSKAPVNFGYPINTHQDEIGLVVNAQGNTGYFSSEREDSRKKDIYTFELPKAAQAQQVTYLRAMIKDKEEKTDLTADVEVSLVRTGELIYKAQNIAQFTIPLPMGKDYAVYVSRSDYLFYSDNILLGRATTSPFEKEILLSHIKQGENLVLKNVLFKLNSYELDTNYTTELNKAVDLIKANPKLHFEISGHTDNIGSKAYNQELSEQRAKVVYDYFISQGIDDERLTYKGYGDSRPISDTNDDNRRTELLIK